MTFNQVWCLPQNREKINKLDKTKNVNRVTKRLLKKISVKKATEVE